MVSRLATAAPSPSPALLPSLTPRQERRQEHLANLPPFAAFSVNLRACISKEGFVAVMTRKTGAWRAGALSLAEAEAAFALIDSEGTGFVDYEDLVSCWRGGRRGRNAPRRPAPREHVVDHTRRPSSAASDGSEAELPSRSDFVVPESAPPTRRPAHLGSGAGRGASHSPVLVLDESHCAALVGRLLRLGPQALVAVGFHGVGPLCRKGRLCLVSLAPPDGPTHLVDVLGMGAAAFGAGRLAEFLRGEPSFQPSSEGQAGCELSTKPDAGMGSERGSEAGTARPAKLVYDCRAGADALYYGWGVRLGGLIDAQLACCKKFDRDRGYCSLLPTFRGALARSRCCPDLPFAAHAEAHDWAARPLPSHLVAHAAAGAAALHRLHAVCRRVCPASALREASEARVAAAIGDRLPASGPRMQLRDV